MTLQENQSHYYKKYDLSNTCNKTSLGNSAFTLQIFSSR